MEIPRKVLGHRGGRRRHPGCGLDRRAAVGVDKLVAKLPKVGPFVSKAAFPALIAAVKMSRSAAQEDQRAGPREPRLPDGDADAVQVGPRPGRDGRTADQEPK